MKKCVIINRKYNRVEWYVATPVKIERGKTFMKRKLTVLMALMLVGAMLFSFAGCGSKEEGDDVAEVFTTEEAVYTQSKTPVANTSEEVLNYFNGIVNDLKAAKPAIYYRYEKAVPDGSIRITKAGAEDAEEIDESLESLNKAAKGIKDMIHTDIGETSGDIPMGADNTEYLYVKNEAWTSQLTIADIDYATIKEIGDNYFIEIVFNDVDTNGDTSALLKAFELRNKDEILASDEFAKTAEYLKFNDYDVEYSGCKITATVNRLTNEITNLNYYKAANITASVTGAGTLADYGDLSVMFTFEDKANFEINWENSLPVSPLETTTEA